jgi:hypothetical protein
LILNPIGKVLSTIRKHRVRALLMGGQACILYGAAEFSRDVDFVVLADKKNLERLKRCLEELRAEAIYCPGLGMDVLQRGHACHFRVQVPEAIGLRVDIMSTMHGCDPFDDLWARRHKLKLPAIGWVTILSLPDLVRAKKTQRDKDWPMIRRLVEVDYHNRPAKPPRRQLLFWLREARTPGLLLEIAKKYPGTARLVSASRTAVAAAIRQDEPETARLLRDEENALREADRLYWQPLRDELFQWRTAEVKKKGKPK